MDKNSKNSKLFIIILFVVAIIVSIICIIINIEGNISSSEPITGIKSFHLGITGIAYRTYDFECNDDICYDDGNEFDKDKIINLLNKYKVREWDGFKKNDNSGWTDADGFDLKIVLDDNSTISASGISKYPKRFYGFRDELFKIIGESY